MSLSTCISVVLLLQAQHDQEKKGLEEKIDELHRKLSEAAVKAARLEGQLIGSNLVTTLTKEQAASATSILYEKIRETAFGTNS